MEVPGTERQAKPGKDGTGMRIPGRPPHQAQLKKPMAPWYAMLLEAYRETTAGVSKSRMNMPAEGARESSGIGRKVQKPKERKPCDT